ncbi:Sau3AI family type II restriction endonuclease [Enterococcus larvae]|uniref:Sau3AI family type II restriction endonuclease n=1 Tax=Enterococcus larvae TaxID=2794352 RepID=UPI003F31BBEB
MEKRLLYDDNDPKSIEAYSKLLIGKTFEDVLLDYFSGNNLDMFEKKKSYYNNSRSKGGLGNLIEKYFFLYEPNGNPEADFPNAGVELKVTPYEQLKNGEYRAGERLVIGMIPNDKPLVENIYDSHVLDKLQLVLLILYLRRRGEPRITFQINYSKLFSILGKECSEDLSIIESDYNTIFKKISQGQAHELSEADTMYLGACTKGATANRSLQPQYYNPDIKAKRRAFSLKQGYMSYILNKYIFKDIDTYESIFKDTKLSREDFERNVIKRIMNFYGQSEEALKMHFGLSRDNSKNVFSRLAFRMLNIQSNNAEEFVKSDTIVKAIRIEKNGTIKESMSFPVIIFNEFINEEWEESYIYNYFSEKRFLFVIYRDNGNGYHLNDVKFWNMPTSDLDKAGKKEWLKVQMIVREGVELTPKGNRITNNFPKGSETEIFHLRPHANKSVYLIDGKIFGNGKLEKDADILPNGDMMTKQCFWLNKDYILAQLNKE